MTLDNELIDNLLKDYKKPEDIMGENGLLKQLTKQLLRSGSASVVRSYDAACRPSAVERASAPSTVRLP